jgi:hypothetical protein
VNGKDGEKGSNAGGGGGSAGSIFIDGDLFLLYNFNNELKL